MLRRLIAISSLSSAALLSATEAAVPTVPLRFEKGDAANSFVASTIGRRAVIDGSGFSMLLPKPIRVSVLNARTDAAGRGIEPAAAKTARFLGRSGWQTGTPTYAKVRYDSVLPGIDLLYHSEDRNLEFDFIVHPGSDPRQIVLRFTGQDDLRLDQSGQLIASAGGASVTYKAPAIYQRTAAGLRLISGAYDVNQHGEVRFALGEYDPDETLIIDPVVVFSAFRGGSGGARAVAISRHANGTVYVAGNTSSPDFATEGAYRDTRVGGQDVFVMKINPSAPADQAVQYVTYLGGGDLDEVTSMTVDAFHRVYLTGFTASTNFPVSSPAHQSTSGGERDAFIVKLDFSEGADSLLAYSTYLGGSGSEMAYSIAADNAGNIYVAGSTTSTNLATAGQPAQGSSGGGMDGFVAHFDGFGTLLYSTYLGGDRTDSARALALAADGSVWVAMNTTSASLPVSGNAYNPLYWSGGDVYLAHLLIRGESPGIRYGTYIGGPNIDNVSHIALDGAGRVVMTGPTQSPDFPRAGVSQPFSGLTDVFVSVIDPAQSGAAALVFSTFIGGKDHDWPNAMAVRPNGDIVVTGFTVSNDYPASSGAQAKNAGLTDAFVTRLRAGSGITYSSYVGGAQNDYAYGVDIDNTGVIWLAGMTTSRIFPADGGQARDKTPGVYDAFVYALQPCEFTLSATSNTVAPGGASATFLVSTTSECSWTATSTAGWITIAAGGSGTGNGEVTYDVAANGSSVPRTGAVTIGGVTHTITQSGVECKVTLEPDATMGPGADVRGVIIQTSAPECSWSGSTSTPWIAITQNQTGTGNGMLIYSVEPNPGTEARVAIIEISGVVFRLTQQGRLQ